MNKIMIVFMLAFFSMISFANENDKYFSIGINADSFAGMEMGYGKSLNLYSNEMVYYLKVSIPIILDIKQCSIDTFELKAGFQKKIVGDENFVLISDFGTNFIRHQDILGTSYPMGMNLKITPAYVYNNNFIGFQVKYNQIFTTFIQHSDVTKDRFNDILTKDGKAFQVRPKDGFYNLTGSYINLGLEGKTKLSDKTDFCYELGMTNYISEYARGFDAVMFGQLPFFVNIQLNNGI